MGNNIVLIAVLSLMIAAAVLTVVTDRLFTAVIFAGALSAFASIGYLFLGAPDVALAEIVVGSTLATVIFLVTLKKYRIFTIYLTGSKNSDAERVSEVAAHALQIHELEPHILHSNEKFTALLSRPDCDLVIEKRDDEVFLHGEASSQYIRRILEGLNAEGLKVTLCDSLTKSKRKGL